MTSDGLNRRQALVIARRLQRFACQRIDDERWSSLELCSYGLSKNFLLDLYNFPISILNSQFVFVPLRHNS